MARHYHGNNLGTNLTSNQIAGVTTTPVNAVPSITVPFYAAFDATNINGHYEEVEITGKTATNINHAATSYAHTTAEEVRFPFVKTEADEFSAKLNGDTAIPGVVASSGWVSYSTVTPTYTSADAPTYTITFAAVDLTSTMSVGMRVKLTDSTVKYFIITAIAFSTNTVVTLYGGTDYTLSGGALSSFNYSSMKAPLGFPLDPTKWTVKVTDTTQRSVAGTGGTYNNIGTTNAQITFPIGVWNFDYQVFVWGDRTTAGLGDSIYVTLSTTNNTATDLELTYRWQVSGVAANQSDVMSILAMRSKIMVMTSKTLYYLNAKMDNSGTWYYDNPNGTMVLRAVCAYL